MSNSVRGVDRVLLVAVCALSLVLAALPGWAEEQQRAQVDWQGDLRVSHNNFTDVKIPYDGFDGWTEVKLSLWLDSGRTVGPYVSLIPAYASAEEFWWQRNAQLGLGVQLYPFATHAKTAGASENDARPGSNPWQSVRLFALVAARSYYDQPKGTTAEDTDLQIGLDYYVDNLFGGEVHSAPDGTPTWSARLMTIAWTNAGFRKTNFSLDDYNAFVWTGNVKAGPGARHGSTVILGYGFADWTYVPRYPQRWWENFLRLGGGLRYYPKASKAQTATQRLAERFHVYAEVVHNAAWLGDEPLARVRGTDVRAGLGFSTGGFLKER